MHLFQHTFRSQMTRNPFFILTNCHCISRAPPPQMQRVCFFTELHLQITIYLTMSFQYTLYTRIAYSILQMAFRTYNYVSTQNPADLRVLSSCARYRQLSDLRTTRRATANGNQIMAHTHTNHRQKMKKIGWRNVIRMKAKMDVRNVWKCYLFTRAEWQ